MTKQEMSSGTAQYAHAPAKRMRGVAFAILTLAVVCLMLTAPVGAADTDIYTVGTDKTHTMWSSAIAAAKDNDCDGNITYHIYGKVTLDQHEIKGAASTINIVGMSDDAELTVTTANPTDNGIVGVSDNKIETVNFVNLNLSRPNGAWRDNEAHHNKFFTVWDSDGSTDLIAYNGCTFLNGSGNNQYGKTTYTDCIFYNDVYYALWIYGSGSAGVVEVTNCYFEADRGVKVYSEDVSATVKTTIENSEFVIDSKPAIVSSIAGELTIKNVNAEKCEYGLLASEPKDGRTDLVHAAVTVDGKEPEFVASVVNSKGGVMYTTSEKFAETEAKPNDPTAPSKVVLPSAKVGDKKYFSLQDAIIAAAPSGTVEILADVTVEKWVMFAESMTHGGGGLITLNINGLTINGNNHNLTINSIESAGNGGYLFYDAEKLNINDLTIKYAEGVSGGIGLQSGTLKNVVFEGGVYGVLPQNGEVIIQDCIFKTTGTSIYFEQERDSLTVTGCTFENEKDANVILLRGDVTFTDNAILSGRTVNVVSGSPTVSGNDFGAVRLKVYSDATATITDNEINNLAFEESATYVNSTFVDNILSEVANTALLKGLDMHTITFTDGENTITAITQKTGATVTAPANPTKSGYNFKGWNVEIPTTMPANDLTIKAQWEKKASSSSSSSSSSSKPKEEPPVEEPETPVTPTEPVAGEVTVETEVTNGGEVAFETPAAEGSEPVADAPVEISAVVLPEGTTGEVAFVPVSEQPAPAGKETQTKKVFEINVPTYEKGKAAVVKFTMTVAELAADGKTASDVALWHFDEETGEWTKLVTSYTIVDGVVYFEAITYDFSPFAIIYEDAVEQPEQPVEEPETPASPAPVLGVLAALGAAVVLRRK